MKQDLREEIELPEKVTAHWQDYVLTIKGPKGEVKRKFLHPHVKLSLEGSKIILFSSSATRKEKTIVGSFAAHIKNILKGVQAPHVYKLTICSGHFPMNIAVSGNELVIKNFLGESMPRRVAIPAGAQVKVEGKEIIVSSPDKEVAGQTAAKFETICRETKKDVRIFMDGLWITEKSGRN